MRKKQLIIIILFIFLMTIIYSDLMIFHQFFSTRILEYTAILLCFIITLILPIRKADWLFVTIALFFTLIADTFLVLLEGYQVIATMSFCIVQSLYAIRLWKSDHNRFAHIFKLRIILLVLMEVIAYLILGESFDVLISITMLYLSLLIGNMIHSLSLKKEQTLFSVALVLFLLCDITVGLSVSGDYLTIASHSIIGKILAMPINLAWLFYLPSQVLIVLSVYFKMNKNSHYQ